MISIETILLNMLAQSSDRYVFGAEASALNPDPNAFDCSELVEWACARSRLVPTMPDGAYNQWVHTQALRIPVESGMRTRGAIMFVGDGTGVGRGAVTHVAVSLGNGTTVEARGARWGVGVWPAAGRFDFAAKIPGATYGTRPLTPPPPPPPKPKRKAPKMASLIVRRTNQKQALFECGDTLYVAHNGAVTTEGPKFLVNDDVWNDLVATHPVKD